MPCLCKRLTFRETERAVPRSALYHLGNSSANLNLLQNKKFIDRDMDVDVAINIDTDI